MARICVDITKPDAGLLAPAQPLHPYAQPPQAVELKDELKMLVLSGDVDALDAKLAGVVDWARKAGHAVAGAGHAVAGVVRKGVEAGQAAAGALKLANARSAVASAEGKLRSDREAASRVPDDEKRVREAQEKYDEVSKEHVDKAKDVTGMAQALRELCLLGRADAGTAPRQLVGIEAEIEAYKQHAAHAQQMQAMAAAVYPGQAPAVYPGQVLASPAVYPGQVLASPAVFQANPQWMRYAGC
jgi:hypothetical protein